MSPSRAQAFAGCALFAWSLTVAPTRAEVPVDYLHHIKPVLTARCYACHGALQQKGGLRLDTVGLMKKGGDSGPAIVAGNGQQSRLISHVSAARGFRRMPP